VVTDRQSDTHTHKPTPMKTHSLAFAGIMSVCGPDGFPEDDGRHGVEGVVVSGARGQRVNGADDDASLGDR